jgi:hypothetical protein
MRFRSVILAVALGITVISVSGCHYDRPGYWSDHHGRYDHRHHRDYDRRW